jgi:hypothetical protein
MTGHTGEDWLRAIDGIVAEHRRALGLDGEAFRFRIDRMRAWRDRREQAPASSDALAFAYVRTSVELEKVRTMPMSGDPVSASTPGLMMLLPMLRARGREVDP